MNTPSASFAETQLSADNTNKLLKYVVLVVLGTLVMTVAAKINVPFYPVPMNLQTLALFAIAAAFGRKLAVATILLYLAEGFMHIPVFTKEVAGPGYFVGPTGGYLVGFAIAAFIVGWAADKGWSKNPFKMFGAMLVADVVIFALGFAWLATLIGPEKAFMFGVQPFVIPDLVKIALASSLVAALWQVFRKA